MLNQKDEAWRNEINSSDDSSFSTEISRRTNETTKSQLIREILREVNTNDSKQKFDQRIYLQCVDENEFGSSPDPDELLEKIDSTKNCSCQRINIKLGNSHLDQILSYKQKLTILRVILRRFQILNHYFGSSKSLTQSDTEQKNH